MTSDMKKILALAFGAGAAFSLAFVCLLEKKYDGLTFELICFAWVGVSAFLRAHRFDVDSEDMKLLLKQARFPLQKDTNG